jgi:hypothetical protein
MTDKRQPPPIVQTFELSGAYAIVAPHAGTGVSMTWPDNHPKMCWGWGSSDTGWWVIGGDCYC